MSIFYVFGVEGNEVTDLVGLVNDVPAPGPNQSLDTETRALPKVLLQGRRVQGFTLYMSKEVQPGKFKLIPDMFFVEYPAPAVKPGALDESLAL